MTDRGEGSSWLPYTPAGMMGCDDDDDGESVVFVQMEEEEDGR